MIKLKGGLSKKMNTKGKASLAGWGIAAVVVIALLILASQLGYLQSFQSDNTPPSTSPETCGQPTTTLSFPAVDFYNQGTSVAIDPVVKKTTASGSVIYVNGTSSSSFGVGEKAQVLYRKADYIDAIGQEFEVTCGLTSAPEMKLYATNTNTFRIFNTNNQLMTDNAAGGVTNQSSSAAPISLEMKIDSRVDQSTGDLVLLLESVNRTEVKSITLSGPGATKTSVPTFYANQAALSIAEAWEIPAIVDGNTATYTVTIEPQNGITIGASPNAFYFTAYSKQAFRDADGSFKTGIENSQGTAQYEDTWDFDFMVRA